MQTANSSNDNLFTTNQVIRFLTKIELSAEEIKSKLGDLDGYNIFPYDFLNDPPSSVSSDSDIFSHFFGKLGQFLDRVNSSRWSRFFHNFWYRVIITTVTIFTLLHAIHDSKETADSLSEQFHILIHPWMLNAIAYLLIALAAIILFIPVWAARVFHLDILKRKLSSQYQDKIRELEKNRNLTENPKIAAHFFKKDKQYLFLWLYPNWAHLQDKSKASQIFEWMGYFLKNNPQLRLVYVQDELDNFDQREDLLANILKKAKLTAIHSIEIEETTLVDVFAEVDKKNDRIFFSAMHREIENLSPGSFVLRQIVAKMPDIYERYLHDQTVDLRAYFLPARSENLNQKKKCEIIQEEIFKTRNAWIFLKEPARELLILLLIHRYITGKSRVPVSLCRKFFLLQNFEHIQKVKEVSRADIKMDLVNPVIKNCKPQVDKFEEDLFSDFKKMKSVKHEENLGEGAFYCLDLPDWVLEFILQNQKSFVDQPDLHLLSEVPALAEFFFFYYALEPECAGEENQFWVKLLSYVPENDRFVLRLLLSDRLSRTPFERDRSGAIYVNSSIWAEKSWLEYAAYSSSVKLNFEFKTLRLSWQFSDLSIDPFRSLYQLLSDAVNRSSNLTCSVEKIMTIIDEIRRENLSPFYHRMLDSLIDKATILFNRYQLYCDQYLQLNENTVYYDIYNDLFSAVEEHLLLLFPIVQEEEEIEVPTIDLQKYWESDSENLDFIFLLLLTTLHNHYLCVPLLDNSRVIKTREGTTPIDKNAILSKIQFVENKLSELQKKPLNFKKYSYFNLYLFKFRNLILLMESCKIEVKSPLLKPNPAISSDKDALLSRFGLIQDYYGEADTLFWDCWFKTRFEGYIVKLVEPIHRLLDICNPDKLGYFHFDGDLIYFSIASQSSIPPHRAYELIRQFLGENYSMPDFLRLHFLKELQILCYNGKFKNKAQLHLESIEISEQILNKYAQRLTKEYAAHLNLSLFSLYSQYENIKPGKARIIYEELKDNVDALDNNIRGIFFFHALDFLRKSDAIEEIQSSNFYDQAQIYLKSNKFYYIQFLVGCIQYFDRIMAKKKVNTLLDEYAMKVKAHNDIISQIKQSDLEQEDAASGITLDKKTVYHEELNVLKKELDELENIIKKESDENRHLNELKEEFDAYTKLGLYDHSSLYLIATTAHVLANKLHGQNSIKIKEYYETALNHYEYLKEWIPYLRVALELKIMSGKRYYLQDPIIQKIENQIRALLNGLEDQTASTYHLPIGNIEKEAETLKYLLHDYLNPNLFKHRTDYDFYNDLDGKINKNRGSYKYDGDTKDPRRSLYLFLYCLGYNASDNNIAEAIKHLGQAFSYAQNHIEDLTHDDLNTLRQSIEKLDDQKSSDPDFNMKIGKAVYDFKKTLEVLWEKYRKLAHETIIVYT